MAYRPLCSAVLVVFVLSFTGFSAAQLSEKSDCNMNAKCGTIEGTVHNSRDEPVAEANVELQGVSISRQVLSGIDGGFVLTNVPEGTYQLIARSKLEETRTEIYVRFGESWVTLSLPVEASGPGGQAVVSRAQLKVPDKARKAFAKAQQAFFKKNLSDTARYLEQALLVCPQYADALTLRGILELNENHFDQARSDGEQAIQYDPNYGQAYFILGAAYASLQQTDQAIRTLDRGLTIAPDSVMGYYLLSKTLLAKGDFPAALQQAERGSRLAARNCPAMHVLKADAYFGLKNPGAASIELQAYLKEEPNGPYSQRAKETLEQLSKEPSNTR